MIFQAKMSQELPHTTQRSTVAALEEVLHAKIPVLDHGFIRVIDYMGDDSAIVQAARVSYGKGTKQVSQDKGLINYLMRHRHTTPFEMCDIKFHIKLPIFVARQWIRHRMASVNEYSARYSILSKEYYLPDIGHISQQSKNNNQGREIAAVSEPIAQKVLSILTEDANRCYEHYQQMLNLDNDGNIIDDEGEGIARELARMNLTLNYYTEWYWKTNLHSLLHFLSLRADKHAQYEIRAYADKLLEIVEKWVPFSYEAFMEYRFAGASFSRSALNVIRRLIKNEPVSREDSGLGKREWAELMEVLQLGN